jgi:uncharacterized protein YjbI with pentapeptide repeats
MDNGTICWIAIAIMSAKMEEIRITFGWFFGADMNRRFLPRDIILGRVSRNFLFIAAVVVILLVLAGVTQVWTGFNITALQFWAVMIVVLIILLGAWRYFDVQAQRRQRRLQYKRKLAQWQARQELEIETEHLQKTAFQSYMDRMTELLLERGLRISKPESEARNIARARTLGVLPGLDGRRKGTILRFLYDSELINGAGAAVMDMRETDLRGVDMSQANFKAVQLSEADLSAADLSGSDLRESMFHKTVLIVANLTGTNLTGADLSSVTLTEAVAAAAKLNEANLSHADLHGANLEGAELIGCNLQQANLCDTILNVANLTEANLQGADLRGANLEGADLIEANLEGADLRDANLRGAVLRGVKYNRQTQWPKGLMPSPSGVIVVE